jgi:hypothetical protein
VYLCRKLTFRRGFLALANRFEGGGEALRQEFFEGVTRYPPDASAWGDFQIPLERYREVAKARSG